MSPETVAEIGDRIGTYEVVRLIARGERSTVYQAVQTSLNRVVALKRLDLHFDDGTQMRRFARDLQTLQSLEHPNIVQVYDCFEHDGMPYIAMEHLPRGSLRPFVGLLQPVQVLGILEGTLEGLAHAEEHGVVHGDLKPANVLITQWGTVKITDFAIAKAYRCATNRPAAVDTVTYMAPEQALDRPVGPYTDLYALGVIAYELLTGEPPFEGSGSPMAAMHRHVNEPPPPAGIGSSLAGWVERLLQKRPQDRPSIAAASAELAQIAVDLHGPRWREDARLDWIPPRGLVELQRSLVRAARAGILPAERPAPRPSRPPVATATPSRPRPSAPAPAPAMKPAPPGRVREGARQAPTPHRRRFTGWPGALRGLILAAVTGGIGYLILDRLLGSTIRMAESDTRRADHVVCTVFAPPAVAPGESFLVQAYLHLPDQAGHARALALEMDTAAARRVFRSLEAPIARGSRLHAELHAPGLKIDDPVTSLVWQGHAEAVQFGVTVPPGASGTVIATLYLTLESAPLGHVKFKTVIESSASVVAGPTSTGPEPQGEDARRYRAAFISYASQDRDEVLHRVQVLPLVGVRYFKDVLSLEPGDRWERRLELGIDECDLFLLFWSSRAKQSRWVREEVAHALKRRGDDELAEPEIKPVIIEGPPVIEPWSELAHLHFNDRTLYFMNR